MSGQQGQRPDLIGIVIASCAIIVTGLALYRTFGPTRPLPAAVERGSPRRISVAPDSLFSGRPLVGPASATVRIVEFADFECPACRTFAAVFDSVRQKYPKEVALVFAHYPLSYHRFALPAARVAECAEAQGRFDAMYSTLYDKQDSLGLIPWASLARAAGVVDLARFEECATSTVQLKAVERDLALAKEIGVRGTPTVIINGWQLPGMPTYRVVDSAVRVALGR